MAVGKAIKEFFVGTPDQQKQISTINPEQQQLWQRLSAMLPGLLNNQGNQQQSQAAAFQPPANQFQFPQLQNASFGPIADEARYNFNTKTIPSIAERFAGLGSQESSGYRAALGNAGRGFDLGLGALESKFNLAQNSLGANYNIAQGQHNLGQSQLAANYNLGQSGQQQNMLLNLLQLLLRPNSENVHIPGQTGALQGLASGLGSALGGPVGGAIGGAAGWAGTQALNGLQRLGLL